MTPAAASVVHSEQEWRRRSERADDAEDGGRHGPGVDGRVGLFSEQRDIQCRPLDSRQVLELIGDGFPEQVGECRVR